jgi:hypothetical protein
LSEWIKTHAKFVVAAVTPVFLAVQAALTDSEITTEEGVAIGVAVVVAVGVLLKANQAPVAE